MLEQFHFLEPLWLLALLPLAALFWLVSQTNTDSRAWEKIIDANLLPLLLQGEDKNTSRFPRFLLAAVWFLVVIALADPVWEKIPRPVFQTNAARVIVLDLSNSMLIDDLKPSRLARARFKVEDILSGEEEGQTGLVLFAGEAFTASPLTRDTETIRSILKVLTPQIMPAQGSRADLGLMKAHELLKQSGIANGQVLLIADGVSQKSASINAAKALRNDGHKVSVMAVGTKAGGKINFRNNVSRTVKLVEEPLSNIAKSGGGNYHLMTTNNTDLKRLLSSATDNSSLEEKQSTSDADENIQNREWHSTGPWLVLILLPFAALVFRKGWLLNIAAVSLIFGLSSQPKEVMAAENESQSQSQPQELSQTNWQNLLERLTKNKAQRANQALINQQYEKARDLSSDPLGRGSAEFKLEEYEEALDSFKQAQGADARYNEANTLAKLEKYEEAIAAYDEALELDSGMQDALDNKKTIEDFLKQQQQSKKKEQSSNENQQGNSDSKNDQQEQQSSDSEDNQEKQSNSQSASKDGKQEQQDQKQGKGEEENNQFSDANKDLEKNQKEAEEEKMQSAQNEPAKDDKNKSGDNEDEDDKSQAEKEQEIASQYEDGSEQNTDKNIDKQAIQELAEELSQEEKMAAEQWLRRIPDDPGGLLRRKFRHQYNQSRRYSNPNLTEQPW